MNCGAKRRKWGGLGRLGGTQGQRQIEVMKLEGYSNVSGNVTIP